MEIILIIIITAVFFTILYFVIKAAVRDGIIEARYACDLPNNAIDEGNNINQTTCPNCGKKHDIDYPKCPYCKQ